MRSFFFALAIAGLVAMPGCKQPAQVTKFDKAFLPYISAFTSGLVSSETTVTVQLTAPVAGEAEVGNAPAQNLLTLNPSVKGEAIWRDAATLEFKPEGALKPGQVYEATFALGQVMQVPDSLANFTFQFKVLEQAVDILVDGVLSESMTDKTNKTVEVTILTADVAASEAVQAAFRVEYKGQEPEMEWTHDASRKMHSLRITGLKRQKEDQNLSVIWNGNPLGIKGTGRKDITIPALDPFRVTATRLQQGTDPVLVIEFSDPLDPAQDLTGLVVLGSASNVRIDRQANVIRLYPGRTLRGVYQLNVLKSIRNIDQQPLEAPYVEAITFEDLKPAVRLVGDGVIVPETGGFVFPFEAVNLRSVDVTIIRIYADNVLQFLQVNDLSDKGELQRVGRIVAVKTINLQPSTPGGLHTWSRYGIRLDELMRAEPGAIYHVGLSFRRSYSLYACSDGTDAPVNEDPVVEYLEGDWDGPTINEQSYWDGWDDWYDWDYNWQNRDNPCSRAYYKRERFAGRNVIASNLGLVAKMGNDGKVVCTVTDLITTEPVSGVKVTLYNFQQQAIANLTTDAKGVASVHTQQKPFMLMAQKDNNVGYLKMQDGRSLSTTRFETQGNTPKDGLKGFLYAERGVWRPGDSVYLSLMLEDKDGRLPDGLPVQFTLINARGQVAHKSNRTASQPLLYDLRFATSPDDATGTWMAIVQAGGSEFRKSLAIETIKPNRLKVELSFDGDGIPPAEAEVTANLSSRWLHGGNAPNLKYQVEMQLRPAGTTFEKFRDFTFDDPASNFSADPQTIAEGKLDGSGKASFPIDLELSSTPPGRLSANFRTRVYEPGGDFSTDRYSLTYDPFLVYVGIKTPPGDAARGMLLTDTNHTVNIITIDPASRPVGNRQLTVELFKLDYSWWWNQEQGEALANFMSRGYSNAIQSETVNTNARGEVRWTLRTQYPEWGRYYIRVSDEAGGHVTGTTVFMDWPGWAGKGRKDQSGGAAILSFTADKERYTVGETVRLSIPSSKGGRALVSLENGRTIMRHFWVTTDEGQTTVDITTDAAMAPNVYAHVTLLQPHGQTENDQPIRLYGIIPIMVEDPATHLKPELQTAATWRPNSKAEIKVSEAGGKAMRYTVAIVDEGLLDLTRFRTPEPWKHFYAKEALGVRTWDMFDLVLGALSGKMEQIISIGGDMEIASPSGQQSINRFKPMVRFLGPFSLDRSQTASHTFELPEYVGSVRVMVVAMGNGQAYGQTEKAVPVKQPVMVLATMPRVLGPGETVQLPVSVFAMDPKVKNVDLSIETSGLLKLKGEATSKLTYTSEGEQLVSFLVQADEAIGAGKIVVRAKSGNEQATQTIEIAVRHPNPSETRLLSYRIDPDVTASMEVKPIGIAGTNSATLELTSLPPMNLAARLQYLIRYPFGCVEQTTSSGFPQLLVRELLDLSPTQKQEMERNINATIARIGTFQQADGGLSYWPGQGGVDDWSTVYGGHFMLEASKRGFQLPFGFLDKWVSHQQKTANQWHGSGSGSNYGYQSDLIQAYRLYTLALAGKPELGAMNRLRNVENLSNGARWRLAAAYALAGQKQEALKLRQGIGWDIPMYISHSGTYGSALRDKAMILETMVLLDLRDAATPLVEEISRVLASDGYLNTQATSYALIAMSKFASGSDEGKPNAIVQIAGKDEQVQSKSHIWQKSLPVKDTGPISVSVKNTRKSTLYANVVLRGMPPVGRETAGNSSLTVAVRYVTIDGTEIPPVRADQGSDMIAEVTVTNTSNTLVSNLALTHIFPSGWEILSSRLDRIEFTGNQASTPEYQDIRDDRIHTFFSLQRGKSATFRYMVSATYQGKFYMPGVHVEAMYDNRIFARTKGQWVEVVEAGAATASVR